MRLNHQEMAEFCKSLALLLHAGLPMGEGLHLLSREETGEKGQLLEAMGCTMDGGLPLYAAMEETGAFPEGAWAMVKIGETTGKLEDTLLYLSEFYDRKAQTARQIKNALGYPALILVLMIGVIFVLLMEVLPVFDRVYASLGGNLTGFAGGLLVAGQGLKAAMPLFCVALSAVLMAGILYCFVRPLKEGCDRWFLRVLGDRAFLHKFNNARFAQAMAMSLGSGMTLEEALEQAQRLLDHIPGAARRCRTCRDLLTEGRDLARSMEEAELLEPAMARLLALGIRSGSTDQTMAEIARRMDRQAQEELEDTVARVEPAMVLACSVLVGAILLAVMLPLVDIMGAIG